MPFTSYKKMRDQICAKASHLYLMEWEAYEMSNTVSTEDIADIYEERIKLTGQIELVANLFNKTPAQIINDIEKTEPHLKDVISQKWFEEGFRHMPNEGNK